MTDFIDTRPPCFVCGPEEMRHGLFVRADVTQDGFESTASRRYWQKVVRDPETECWEWTGHKSAGFCWRIFSDGTWSMCPTNPDNSPIPEPVTYYVSEARAEAPEAREATLREAMERIRDVLHPVDGEADDIARAVLASPNPRAEALLAVVEALQPEAVEDYLRRLEWSAKASDLGVTLVNGNIRTFAAHARAALDADSTTEETGS